MYRIENRFKVKFSAGVIATVVTLLMGSTILSAAGTSSTGTLCASKKTGMVRWTSKSSCKSTERTYTPMAQAAIAGPAGATGPAGANGTNGAPGARGADGIDGPEGPQGEPGLQGNITGHNIIHAFESNSGFYPSVAFGTDGLPVIAGAANTDSGYHLRIMHCSDMSCSRTPVTTDYDTGSASTGFYSSIMANPADGFTLVAFYDETNTRLKVLHCENTICTQGTVSTVDQTSGSGAWGLSLTIGSDGLGLIYYYASATNDLKVAHCADAACTSATSTTLDSAGNVGGFGSITTGVDGLGIISYSDNTNKDLKIAHCSNVACSSATISSVDTTGDPGYYSSIAIGLDGLAIISHVDTSTMAVHVSHCQNVNCTTATTVALPVAGWATFETSMAIGRNGLPIIVHRLGEEPLRFSFKVTTCATATCSVYSTYELYPTSTNIPLIDPEVTIAPDGLPFIIGQYVTGSPRYLATVHCGTITCSPWVGRNR